MKCHRQISGHCWAAAHHYYRDDILFLGHFSLLAAAPFMVAIREFTFVWFCPLAKDKGSSYFMLDQFSSELVSWTGSLRVFWKAKLMEEQLWKTRIRNMKKVGKRGGWDILPSVSLSCQINSAVLSSYSDTSSIFMQVVSSSRWITYVSFIHIILNFCSKI